MNPSVSPERPATLSSFSMAPLLAVSPGLPSKIRDAIKNGQRTCAAFLLVRDLGLSPDDASELVR